MLLGYFMQLGFTAFESPIDQYAAVNPVFNFVI